jgi:hypothetical protein
MKKLFTLIIAVFSLSAVFAQYGHQDRDRNYDRGQSSVIIERDNHSGYDRDYNRNDNRYMMHNLVEKINWKYDRRIADVQNDPFIRPWKKDRIINNLDRERREEIRSVYVRSGRDYNRF